MKIKKTLLVLFTCVFFAFHFLLSHYFLVRIGKTDIYPFFTWDLFSFLPSEKVIYSLYVISLNGQKVQSDDLSFIFKNIHTKQWNIIPHQIDQFGRALEINPLKTEAIRLKRKEFERNAFNRVVNAEYQIRKLKIDLIPYLKGQDKGEMKVLGQFKLDQRWP